MVRESNAPKVARESSFSEGRTAAPLNHPNPVSSFGKRRVNFKQNITGRCACVRPRSGGAAGGGEKNSCARRTFAGILWGQKVPALARAEAPAPARDCEATVFG